MIDFALTIALWWTPVLALVLLLRVAGKAALHPGWLVIAVVIHAIYVAAVFSGISLPGLAAFFADSRFNWEGKLFAIAVSLVLLGAVSAMSPRASFAKAGVTLRQAPGSLAPALLMTAAMVFLMIGLQLLANDGTAADADTLLYQATIPGLDEELLFRGLLLMVLSLAVTGGVWRLAGAPVGWSAVFATLVFALGHSVFVEAGTVQIIWAALVYSFVLGGMLMWIRLRTGSILLPIVAHNLTNVAGQFF